MVLQSARPPTTFRAGCFMRMRTSWLFTLLCTLAPSFVASQTRLSLVQTYFIPLPEDDLLNSFQLINNDTTYGARGPITTIISLAIAADGTRIVYDQWEDGYEADLWVPKQSSTQIWGDGNITNGAAPGVLTNAADVLRGGQSIVLQNQVPAPRNGNRAHTGTHTGTYHPGSSSGGAWWACE